MKMQKFRAYEIFVKTYKYYFLSKFVIMLERYKRIFSNI